MTASPASDRRSGASTTGLSMTWVLTTEGLQMRWTQQARDDEKADLEFVGTHLELPLAA